MSFESYYKKISEELSKATIAFTGSHPETKNNHYPQELIKVFEKYIEVHGDGYCMDVASERKKISKLLYRLLNELKH